MRGLKHRAGTDGRAAAILALNSVIHKGEDSQAALGVQIESSNLVPSDKSLCTELFYGVLRHHLRLEWYLKGRLPRPEKLPLEAMLILELAAYELAHTRIPAHASVNWAVELVNNRFGKGLAGVVNAVLRNFERSKQAEYLNFNWYVSELGESETSPLALGLYYAMPEWITSMWLDSYGYEATLGFLKAGLLPAMQAVRVNAASEGSLPLLEAFLNESGAKRVGPWMAALSKGTSQPVKILLREGRLSRQSPGAYEALWGLDPQSWPTPIWDGCAGRGGKSLALLETGLPVLMLTDPAKSRISAVPAELARLGLTDLGVEYLQKGVQATGFIKKFGTVLLDVPCSGLGTLSHRPEIRWRRTKEDLQKLRTTQLDILESAVQALTPGGNIIYLTCTLNPDENQGVIQSFLQKHPDFYVGERLEPKSNSPYREFFYGCRLKQELN